MGYILEQQSSAFLTLRPFNTALHAVVTSNHKIISLLFYSCNCATVMNHDVKHLICRISDMQPLTHRLKTTVLGKRTRVKLPFINKFIFKTQLRQSVLLNIYIGIKMHGNAAKMQVSRTYCFHEAYCPLCLLVLRSFGSCMLPELSS